MSTHARSPTAELSTLKTISIVLAFTAAVGLVMGTAGFASIDGDRGIEATVTDDESAYFGINETDEIPMNEPAVPVVFWNQFDVPLTSLDVEPTAGGNATVELVDAPDEIDVGGSAPVTVFVHCNGEETVDLAFEVTATGDSVRVDTTVERTFDCTSSGADIDVTFVGQGAGHVEISGPESVFPLNDVVVYWEQGSEEHTTVVSVARSGEKIEGREGVNGKIVAVEIPQYGVYVEPGGSDDAPNPPAEGGS